MKLTMINDRWQLALPDHRADRPEWSWWEATRLSAMHHFIRPGELVWDIGAEEGDFPALYALWGARVVLIEPNPKAWPNIKSIFETNKLTKQVYGTFVGFAADEIVPGEWYPVKFRGWPPCADAAVVADHGFLNLFDGGRPQTTIDNMVDYQAFDPPHHITIDVEGSEYRVLFGAQHTIEQFRPYVWVSVHPDAMRMGYNDDPSSINDLMSSHGYERIFLAFDHEEHVLFIPKEKCWVL